MATHTPGEGASVSGASYLNPSGEKSKERYVWGILALLESEENSLAKVPERTDKITISVDLSTRVANIDLLLNVVASSTAGGGVIFNATHYLVGSMFTAGTGGNSNPGNLAQAAMDAVVGLKMIELTKNRNPENKTVITRCTHVVSESGGTNATFTAFLEFPVEVITLPGGGNVVEGKGWLT
ncbi:hypothetical protein [Microcoleus sp. herbarium2]|uniref:hypothetical protein n=1 Tax=Microcoleus sp. herbarium2 TaxID=3055433 RepID=UPI002FD7391E